MPSVASGGKLGEEYGENDVELVLVLLLPRNSR